MFVLLAPRFYRNVTSTSGMVLLAFNKPDFYSNISIHKMNMYMPPGSCFDDS